MAETGQHREYDTGHTGEMYFRKSRLCGGGGRLRPYRAGVHARGQTASVVLRGLAEDGFFLKQVNGILPPDIRILEAALVKNGFHARKSAVGKVYEYYIDTGERPDVFTRRYCFHYPRKLDLSAMRTAAGCLIGTHEFAGYTDKKEEKSTKRTIYAIIVSGQGSRVKIRYEGTGFLYHMVRILTGTLIEAGTGERSPESAGRCAEDAGQETVRFPCSGTGTVPAGGSL